MLDWPPELFVGPLLNKKRPAIAVADLLERFTDTARRLGGEGSERKIDSNRFYRDMKAKQIDEFRLRCYCQLFDVSSEKFLRRNKSPLLTDLVSGESTPNSTLYCELQEGPDENNRFTENSLSLPVIETITEFMFQDDGRKVFLILSEYHHIAPSLILGAIALAFEASEGVSPSEKHIAQAVMRVCERARNTNEGEPLLISIKKRIATTFLQRINLFVLHKRPEKKRSILEDTTHFQPMTNWAVSNHEGQHRAFASSADAIVRFDRNDSRRITRGLKLKTDDSHKTVPCFKQHKLHTATTQEQFFEDALKHFHLDFRIG